MPARILVVRPGALGDTILALPALGALAAGCPSAELEIVGYPSVLRLLEHTRPPLPVRRTHAIDRALFAPLLAGPMSGELEELLASCDLLIAWVHDHSDDLRAKLERLPIACLRADPYPPEGSGVHASHHLLRTLTPLWPAAHFVRLESRPGPTIEAPPHALLESEGLLRHLGLEPKRFIAMHPGSGSARKNWPAEKFGELLRLAEGAGRRVLLIEGAADEEAVGRVARIAGGSVAHFREPSLLTLAAILSQACVFVGNDSGVSHLAAATGTPTLAIFGPTDAVIWAPRAPNARVLRFETPVTGVWAELEPFVAQ
ncbi:MAG: glycosyltransferase family 9 protein [Vicinamibacteria bacterium]